MTRIRRSTRTTSTIDMFVYAYFYVGRLSAMPSAVPPNRELINNRIVKLNNRQHQVNRSFLFVSITHFILFNVAIVDLFQQVVQVN